MNRLYHIELGLKKQKLPAMKAGDTLRVYVRISEGEKERTQVFEGTLIARKGRTNRETITVRKISFGVGVERIFPLHSPVIEKIDVVRKGRVRRSKLYYLRGRKGQAAKVEESKTTTAAKPVEPLVSEDVGKPEPVQSERT